MFKTIVWATDGSDVADAAIPVLTELALEEGSTILALHVDQRFRGGRFGGGAVLADEDELIAKITEQVTDLCHAGIDATLKVEATDRHNIAELVATYASELDADLVVVGTYGRHAATTAVLGSVAKALLHTAQCPVLVVPISSRKESPTRTRPQLVTS
ncbi:MAG TPA: universal stress protein [Gaiellaceae bacterium]|nr:universal stress protein [Gaiellaceae bacterium]